MKGLAKTMAYMLLAIGLFKGALFMIGIGAVMYLWCVRTEAAYNEVVHVEDKPLELNRNVTYLPAVNRRVG